jgi:hypothetical protein
MALIEVLSNLRSKFARGFLRGLAVLAIIFAYGLGQIAVTGAMMTASTTSAQAWWRGGRGWGWRGGGWRGGRGWGWRGGGGWCYWHPYACRGW